MSEQSARSRGGLSNDPQARHRQLQNLSPAARVDHGARSPGVLAPFRERHAVELRRDYPQLDERRLALLADLLAQIEVASGHIDRRGIVTDKRTLELRSIVRDLQGWRQTAWKWLAELEAGVQGAPAANLESVLAELAESGQEPGDAA